MKLGELIETLGGQLAEGNPEQAVEGVNSVELASGAELVFAEDVASAVKALASEAGAVVLRAGFADRYPRVKCVIEAPQPRLWFVRAARLLAPAFEATGIHPAAVIGVGVELGDSVTIGPCAVVGDNARVGDGTRIDSGAVVGAGVLIGAHCRVYPQVVIYPEPRFATGLSSMPARCSARTASAMCATPRPAPTPNFRSRGRC